PERSYRRIRPTPLGQAEVDLASARMSKYPSHSRVSKLSKIYKTFVSTSTSPKGQSAQSSASSLRRCVGATKQPQSEAPTACAGCRRKSSAVTALCHACGVRKAPLKVRARDRNDPCRRM